MSESRTSTRTRTILGLVVLPGLQWSKYLVENDDGTLELAYKSDLVDMCRSGAVTNGAIVVREKRAYDDWGAGPELRTTPPDLFERNVVHVSLTDDIDDHDRALADATRRLVRIADENATRRSKSKT